MIMRSHTRNPLIEQLAPDSVMKEARAFLNTNIDLYSNPLYRNRHPELWDMAHEHNARLHMAAEGLMRLGGDISQLLEMNELTEKLELCLLDSPAADRIGRSPAAFRTDISMEETVQFSQECVQGPVDILVATAHRATLAITKDIRPTEEDHKVCITDVLHVAYHFNGYHVRQDKFYRFDDFAWFDEHHHQRYRCAN